jgi:hypothetical protein
MLTADFRGISIEKSAQSVKSVDDSPAGWDEVPTEMNLTHHYNARYVKLVC